MCHRTMFDPSLHRRCNQWRHDVSIADSRREDFQPKTITWKGTRGQKKSKCSGRTPRIRVFLRRHAHFFVGAGGCSTRSQYPELRRHTRSDISECKYGKNLTRADNHQGCSLPPPLKRLQTCKIPTPSYFSRQFLQNEKQCP